DRDRGRDRDRGDRPRFERGGDRDRGGKPKRRNENMTRFFFNLGKRDQLKKMDMLEIINKATAKSKKRADIGDIEILEKFSFFEVEKSFKEEVLKGIASQKYKGKEMRAEVAN
ncbi:MAG: DbpA RNA binding domain-containing protein, partial [Cloacibacterium sp.]|nr:DbpA RNA binding domain-containing protein [Cloacibacterium sp.]